VLARFAPTDATLEGGEKSGIPQMG
jgi:hypothetical protein